MDSSLSSRPVIFQTCPASRNGRREKTIFCCPFWLFSKVAQHSGIKDRDGQHSVLPSCLFLNVPDKKTQGPGQTKFCRPWLFPAFSRRSQQCPAGFLCLLLLSIVSHRFPPSPTIPHRPHSPRPSLTIPYQNMS